MTPSSADRRLLVLCGLIPLSQLTQDEVDYLFRTLVEDSPPDGDSGPPEPDYTE